MGNSGFATSSTTTEADGQPVAGFIAVTDCVVDALAVVGNQLYLGGSFTTVNGVARKNLSQAAAFALAPRQLAHRAVSM